MSEQTEQIEQWHGEHTPQTRRIGHAPEDIPADGSWYIMRSSPWIMDEEAPAVKRIVSQRITHAVRYMRRGAGVRPGFDVKKVREHDKDGGRVRWHMLGRWEI